jgi:DNA mismatch repair protein MutS
LSKTTKSPEVQVTLTPLMQQYQQVKQKYPDALLLFRVGDFYETFGEDAIKVAKTLGIVQTSRNNGGSDVELAGFPYHSLDLYLPRLVKAGFRVAICEQLEKPSPLKKIVKRGVTALITPGVATDDKLLDQSKNNFLATLVKGNQDQYGIALLDISTGEFIVSQNEWNYIEKLITGFNPSEILMRKSDAKEFNAALQDRYYTYPLEDWFFEVDYTYELLVKHFEVKSLKGFGIEDQQLAQIAAGAALHYLAATENNNLQHINSIQRLYPENNMWLDRFTIKNLELVDSNYENGTPLIKILDKTLSPMGARMIRKWVLLPLTKLNSIHQRHEIVAYFIENDEKKVEVESFLCQIGDLERLISKVPLLKINPREVIQLKRALNAIEDLSKVLLNTDNEQLKKIADGLNPCKLIKEEIEKMMIEEAPVHSNRGGLIKDGNDPELDDLRNIIQNSQSILLDIQRREIEATGIPNLKISFNNVFGYYIEVTNKYKESAGIPSNWIRKQTLANCERYITDELKVLEEKILGAEEKITAIEEALFQKLVFSITNYIQPIQHNAHLAGIIDCLRSFSEIAIKNNYVKPIVNDSLSINIKQGRHPVIEKHLKINDTYVPNDVYLDNESQQIIMITGPNMAGKSALLRQTALICLMAQIGSYVPAASAEIGYLDKIFTRVGASDNISLGESTFMVEMYETANIMNKMSSRSLILLDEIGRGTSTYDGISIAWSIAEYLHETEMRPKTLFATHYHELNELTKTYSRIKNFHVSTKEVGNQVIFLRKLVVGGSEHSFGIHVAKMAGMPKEIVDRSNIILKELEKKHTNLDKKQIANKLQNISAEPMQLNFFDIGDPRLQKIKDALDNVDINSVTPVELMMMVNEWKKMLD